MKPTSSLLALAYSALAECAATGPQKSSHSSHKPLQTPAPSLHNRNLLHGATRHTSSSSQNAIDAFDLGVASLDIAGISVASILPTSASLSSTAATNNHTSTSSPASSSTDATDLDPIDVIDEAISAVVSAVQSAIPIFTDVYDYSSTTSSTAAAGTAATAAMASPSCTTIFAPYANATRTRALGTGRTNRIVASASGSLITAAPMSTVICRTVTVNTTSSTTQSSYDVFYNSFTSTYTYPDGQTCTLLPKGQAAIVISYYREPESTITFTGNASDYTAPYSVPAQPTWCNFLLTPTPTPSASASASKTGGFVLSVGAGLMTAFDVLGSDTTSTIYAVDHNPSVIFVSSETLPSYGDATSSAVQDHASAVDDSAAEVAMGAQVVTAQDFQQSLTSTTTTAKTSRKTSSTITATVLFPEASPKASSTATPVAFAAADSVTASTGSALTATTKTSSSKIELQIQSAGAIVARTTSFAVTAGPDQVVINDNTYTGLDASKTTTVTCSGATFTIDPSRIVKAGGSSETISRLVPGVTGLVANVNTSTVLHGLTVAVTKGTVQLGDYIYTIGSSASTETVMGQTVTIAPTGIAIADAKATLSFTATVPDQTEIVVAGGQMVTALGQSVVVIRRTSITYATATTTLTSTIDDNTLLIGPSGVIIDRTTTLGGPTAETAAVQYAIVGGATLTQVGASKLIVHNTTYTVGPHAATAVATITAAGQTISISSGGVEAGTVTLDYPFGPSVTTTFVVASTTTAAVAQTSAGSVKANSNKSGDSSSSSSSSSNSGGSSHVKSGSKAHDGAGGRVQTPSVLAVVVAGGVAVLLF